MKLSMRMIPVFFFGWITLSVFAAPALALQHLEGGKALDYIGNPKQKFTGGGYTYEVLKRSHRDTMNGRFSDALIFSNSTDRFYYKKRVDGQHIVVLGHPKGREEDPVTDNALVWKPILNTLSDDHPDPHVYLDDSGKELAVVYIGKKTQLEAEIDSDGLLELRIHVRGSSRRQVGSRN
jgi:hypothetical protein